MVSRVLILLTLITGLLQPVPAFALSAPEGAAEVPCEQDAHNHEHCPGEGDCRCAQACGGLVTDAAVFNPPKPPVETVFALPQTRVLSAFVRPPFRPPIR